MRPLIGITCSREVGGAWGLYSRRSLVQIYPPLPIFSRGCNSLVTPSFCVGTGAGQHRFSNVFFKVPVHPTYREHRLEVVVDSDGNYV